jgi:hypothetical protein
VKRLGSINYVRAPEERQNDSPRTFSAEISMLPAPDVARLATFFEPLARLKELSISFSKGRLLTLTLFQTAQGSE